MDNQGASYKQTTLSATDGRREGQGLSTLNQSSTITTSFTREGGSREKQGRGKGREGGRRAAPVDRSDIHEQVGTKVNTWGQRIRATHFLAIPLNNHAELRKRVSTFQDALMDVDSKLGSVSGKPIVSTQVEGLDTSIVIDPRRLHFTLGVMALEAEEAESTVVKAKSSSPIAEQETASDTLTLPPDSSHSKMEIEEATSEAAVEPSSLKVPDRALLEAASPTPDGASSLCATESPRKTVASALSLLQSLKPQIAEALGGRTGVHVPLNVMDVLKTEHIPPHPELGESSPGTVEGSSTALRVDEEGKVGAGVLFLGPGSIRKDDDEGQRLLKVCDIIHQAFREAGYITESRPLNLHCTILNASLRKPWRRRPFSYTDIRQSPACNHLALTGRMDVASATLDDSTDARDEGGVGMELSQQPPVSIVDLPEAMPDNRDDNNTAKLAEVPLAWLNVPAPLPVNLGSYLVEEVQLWVMGSHGPRGEYISFGGVELK